MINRDQITNLRKLFIKKQQEEQKLNQENFNSSSTTLNTQKITLTNQQENKQISIVNLNNTKIIQTQRTRTIAVTSGKGGAGKTNFVANLAIALSKFGKKVLILDADLGLANVDVICGIRPRYNLFHVITGQKSLSEIIVQGPNGILIAPGGSGIVELANINETERKHFLYEMQELEKKVDIILVDTSAGINKNVLCFLKACLEIVLITLPEPPAIADAYGIIKAAQKEALTNDHKMYLVVNRVLNDAEANDVYERLSNVSKRFLNVNLENIGYILEDKIVPLSVKTQTPYMITNPKSQAALCIECIAKKLLNINELKIDQYSMVDKFKNNFVSFFSKLGELFN